MPKSFRNKLKDYQEENVELSSNHTKKFEDKLTKELHQSKSNIYLYKWLSIAASLLLLIGFAIKFYSSKNSDTELPVLNQTQQVTLGTISPELNSIEMYYSNSINYELSQIEITKENKEMLDVYLTKVGELTKEYKLLTQELNKNGVNDATIDALINNLQLRLQLLKRLKKQLLNLKKLNTKQDEIKHV